MRAKGMPRASHLIFTALALPALLTLALASQILHGHFPELPNQFSPDARLAGAPVDSRLKVPCEEPLGRSSQQAVSESSQDAGVQDENAATAMTTHAGEVNGRESAHSNYLNLHSVKSLLVSDSRGHSEPFGGNPAGRKLKRLVIYDYTGKNSLMISAPVVETYTVTFQPAGEGGVAVDLVRGKNNGVPDMAMRYNDLFLPAGVTAMLKLTAQGIEPLRLDEDGDGAFETILKPDAAVEGAAARDLYAPTICFGESRRGANSLVTIAAADSSGARAIYYSLDAMNKDGMEFQIYDAPFEVDAARTPVVYAFADDRIGNRSGFYDFKLSR